MSAAYNPNRLPRFAVDDSGYDWCSRAGAIQLKERIEAFWKERGFSVDVKVAAETFLPSLGRSRYDVRSNMRNGKPA